MPNSSMKVRSTNINDVAYDSKSQTLSVTFRDGSTYSYFDVPESEYKSMMSAQSVGEFFYRQIRNRYSTTKVK